MFKTVDRNVNNGTRMVLEEMKTLDKQIKRFYNVQDSGMWKGQ